LVDALHGFEQPFTLLSVGQQLQLEGKLHYLGVYHSLRKETTGADRAGTPFLRRLKSAVSGGQIL
jgi:hypothetical protein